SGTEAGQRDEVVDQRVRIRRSTAVLLLGHFAEYQSPLARHPRSQTDARVTAEGPKALGSTAPGKQRGVSGGYRCGGGGEGRSVRTSGGRGRRSAARRGGDRRQGERDLPHGSRRSGRRFPDAAAVCAG